MKYLKLLMIAIIFLGIASYIPSKIKPTISTTTSIAEVRAMNNIQTEVEDPASAVDRLKEGNIYFQQFSENPALTPLSRLEETSENGQVPFTVVLTCSDSRVPPEHIFSAGVGDLFVIRTAGNVVNDFELGSIEYGVKSLGAKIIVIMGHTHCGAVEAAVGGAAEGHIQSIIDEIKNGIAGETDLVVAEDLNIAYSMEKIKQCDIIAEMIEQGDISVIAAKYDIATGKVDYSLQHE